MTITREELKSALHPAWARHEELKAAMPPIPEAEADQHFEDGFTVVHEKHERQARAAAYRANIAFRWQMVRWAKAKRLFGKGAASAMLKGLA